MKLTKEYAMNYLDCDVFVAVDGDVYAYDSTQEPDCLVTDKETGDRCFGAIDYKTMNVSCYFVGYRIGDDFEDEPPTYHIYYPMSKKYAEDYAKYQLLWDKINADKCGNTDSKTAEWYRNAEKIEEDWKYWESADTPYFPSFDFSEAYDEDKVWTEAAK